MNDLTVLFYSANTENEKFEWHIRNNILRLKGDLPLISVTQKPLQDFGQNICVGEHFNCYGNEFRQIQIGLREVKTTYVITAEADVLYPPEYFLYQPTDADYYRYANVWVKYIRDDRGDPNSWVNMAYFKGFSDGAQIIKRDYWLKLLDDAMGQNRDWYTKEDAPRKLFQYNTPNTGDWTSENPVVTFKTRAGVSSQTPTKKSVPPQVVLPYWGDINKLTKKIFR